MKLKFNTGKLLLLITLASPMLWVNIITITNANSNILPPTSLEYNVSKDTVKWITDIKNKKLSKKELKEEIKKKKRYHKLLLDAYQKDLKNMILLDLITKNWIELSNLYKEKLL